MQIKWSSAGFAPETRTNYNFVWLKSAIKITSLPLSFGRGAVVAIAKGEREYLC